MLMIITDIISTCKTIMINIYTGTIKVKIKENFPDMKFLNIFFFAKFGGIYLRDHLTCIKAVFFFFREK